MVEAGVVGEDEFEVSDGVFECTVFLRFEFLEPGVGVTGGLFFLWVFCGFVCIRVWGLGDGLEYVVDFFGGLFCVFCARAGIVVGEFHHR